MTSNHLRIASKLTFLTTLKKTKQSNISTRTKFCKWYKLFKCTVPFHMKLTVVSIFSFQVGLKWEWFVNISSAQIQAFNLKIKHLFFIRLHKQKGQFVNSEMYLLIMFFIISTVSCSYCTHICPVSHCFVIALWQHIQAKTRWLK